MKIKNIIDEDFCNYKKPAMFIGFPKCNFKCEKECPEVHCQNRGLATSRDIEIDVASICERYIKNPISKAIVCGGLEPFDSFDSLYKLIKTLRIDYQCEDPIIIYTGYYSYEITDMLTEIAKFPNIIIKTGRYKVGDKPHFDELLGVNLSSDNQKASVLS